MSALVRASLIVVLALPMACRMPVPSSFSAKAHRILRDQVIQLAADEGLVVLDLESDMSINRLVIGNRSVDIRPGHLVLAVFKVGDYSFERAETSRYHYPLGWLQRNQFDVVAGRVNYPGRLVFERLDRRRFLARVVNRSASVMPELDARYPIVLSSYPLRYAGSIRDDFYEAYSEAIEKLSSRTPELRR